MNFDDWKTGRHVSDWNNKVCSHQWWMIRHAVEIQFIQHIVRDNQAAEVTTRVNNIIFSPKAFHVHHHHQQSIFVGRPASVFLPRSFNLNNLKPCATQVQISNAVGFGWPSRKGALGLSQLRSCLPTCRSKPESKSRECPVCSSATGFLSERKRNGFICICVCSDCTPMRFMNEIFRMRLANHQHHLNQSVISLDALGNHHGHMKKLYEGGSLEKLGVFKT